MTNRSKPRKKPSDMPLADERNAALSERSPSEPSEQASEEEDGVESEYNEEPRITNPYNPDLIRVEPRVYSLRQILDMIRDGELDLAPDFQRKLVWDERRKARLIESILLRIPLPAFYFDADKQGRLSVIDGIQRLSAVKEFVTGGYALRDLEYLRDLTGKRFADLDPLWTRRINQTQIAANVIDPQTPEQVKFDIFRRINTGGQPLNTQELRHCIGRQRSRQLLQAWAARPEFQQATQETLKNHRRMKDREAVLRFLAFRLAWPHITDHYGPTTQLDDFLTQVMKRIDDPKQIPDSRLAVLEQDFLRAMKNASLLFGKHAFRKWPMGDERSPPLNIALLESWAVPLADYQADQLAPHTADIVTKARQVMRDDREYFVAITRSTSNQGAVRKRFDTAREILRDCTRTEGV